MIEYFKTMLQVRRSGHFFETREKVNKALQNSHSRVAVTYSKNRSAGEFLFVYTDELAEVHDEVSIKINDDGTYQFIDTDSKKPLQADQRLIDFIASLEATADQMRPPWAQGELAPTKKPVGYYPDGRELNREDLVPSANLEGIVLLFTTAEADGFADVGATLNLKGANLRNAVLNNLDLEGANLELTDLQGADFEGTNLTGAKLGGAIIIDAINFPTDRIHYEQLNFSELMNSKITFKLKLFTPLMQWGNELITKGQSSECIIILDSEGNREVFYPDEKNDRQTKHELFLVNGLVNLIIRLPDVPQESLEEAGGVIAQLQEHIEQQERGGNEYLNAFRKRLNLFENTLSGLSARMTQI